MIPNFITNLKRRRLGVVAVALAIASVMLFGSAQTALAVHGGTEGGVCMVERFNATKPASVTDLNCTSNDVQLAVYELIEGPDSCIEGEDIKVVLKGEFLSTAAERWDVGVFIHENGGTPNSLPASADDTCYSDYLHPVSADNTDLDLLGGAGPFFNGEITEDPGDACGDIQQGNNAFFTTAEITIKCQDSDDNGIADVGTCTVWANSRSDGTEGKPSCIDEDDVTAETTAKCTCANVEISGLRVPFDGTIEVIKELVPDTDPGAFNLQIDGETEFTDAGDGDSTGAVKVSAGFSDDPAPIGDTHNVGEIAGTDTDLADYDTEIFCEDDDGHTASALNAGPLDIFVEPDDAWVCTITNTIKPGTIIVDKVTDPPGDPTIFDFALTGGPDIVNVSFSLTDADTPFDSGDLTPGTYSVTETPDEEFDTTVVCLSSEGNSETPTAIELDADETVTCTFTNKIKVTGLKVTKTVTTENGTCPGVEVLDVFPGQTVRYCYEVENTGNATAFNVTLEDDNGTPGDTGDDFFVTPLTGLTDGDLPVGETAEGEALVTIADDVTIGETVINIATADADNADPATDDAKVLPADVDLEIVKTVVEAGNACPANPLPDPNGPEPQLAVASGDTVRYCYWIENLGPVAAIDLTLADDTVDVSGITLTGPTDIDGDGNDDDLDVAGIATGYVEVQVFGLIGDSIVNTGTADALNADPDTDKAQVDFITTAATCSVLKTVSLDGNCPGVGEVVVRQGDDTLVTYCYELANGGFDLTDVTFEDDQLGDLGAPSNLAAGASFTPTTAAIVNVDTVNTATATGIDPGGNEITCLDTAAVNAVNPEIEIVKTAMVEGGTCGTDDVDPLEVIGPTNVEYCYKVFNRGDTEITTATVTDDNATADTGDDFTVGTVGPIAAGGESGYLTSGPVLISANRVNLATVEGTDANGFGVNDSDPATVNYKFADVAIEKSGPDVIDTTTCGDPCQFDYTLTVTNLGNTTAVNVTVNDTAPDGIDFIGASSTKGVCGGDADSINCTLGDLAPGESVSITINAEVEDGFVGSTTNEACVATDTFDADETNNCDDQTTRITAGATRTIGYWKTHPEALEYCLDFEPIELGFTRVDDVEDALAVLKSNIAQCPDDLGKRSRLGKARLQAGRQVLALICNDRVLGTNCELDIDGFVGILGDDDADVHDIIQVGSEADVCNNSGSDIPDEVLEDFSPANPKHPFEPSLEGCDGDGGGPPPRRQK
jgi:uncharacterized repeat protein (TIGR01451 family)